MTLHAFTLTCQLETEDCIVSPGDVASWSLLHFLESRRDTADGEIFLDTSGNDLQKQQVKDERELS